MLVVASRGSDYTVEDLSTHRLTILHASRLKQFRYDATRVDPKDIAAKEINEFYVGEILDHRPRGESRPLRSRLAFKVRWLGYDESDETWEPWSELRSNSIVHAYCRAHGMGSIVSKIYTAEVAEPEPPDDFVWEPAV
jgi:hypothetical protein